MPPLLSQSDRLLTFVALFLPSTETHLSRLMSCLSPTILQGLSSGCPVIVYSDV